MRIMKFYSGQKVLCVNDHFNPPCAYMIRKGSEYIIRGFYKCTCGSDQVTLVGIPDNPISMICRCGRISTRPQTYYSWRFIPIEYFESFICNSSEKQEELTDPGSYEIIEECICGLSSEQQKDKN
jgi:hypothetical protein